MNREYVHVEIDTMLEQGGCPSCEINQAFLNSVKIGSIHGGSYLEV